VTVVGSLTNAVFGAVFGDVVEVTQSVVPEALLATHPAGKAGAVTPSKFSVKKVVVFSIPIVKV